MNIFVSWLEEIIAEMIGTLLEEQGFIQSFLSLLPRWVGNDQELKKNDGIHPVPWLRPFIRHHTLLKENRSLESVDALCQRLQSCLSFKTSLTLNIPAMSFEAFLKPQTPENIGNMLVTMLSGEGGTSEEYWQEFPGIPSITLEFQDVDTIIQDIVTHLYPTVTQILQAGLPEFRDPQKSFKQLVAFAEDKAKKGGTQSYKILLCPKILEGGDEAHPHNCFAWSHIHYGVYLPF